VAGACLYYGENRHYTNKCLKKKKPAQVVAIQERYEDNRQPSNNYSKDDTSDDNKPPTRYWRKKLNRKLIKKLQRTSAKNSRQKAREEIQAEIRQILQKMETQKGEPTEECLTIQKSSRTKQFRILVLLENVRTIVLVDSGAGRNYINKWFVKTNQINWK
jgi:hypothetical protein